jgi:hypothetical protein
MRTILESLGAALVLMLAAAVTTAPAIAATAIESA